MNSILWLWIVLAVLFLALAVYTFFSSRPIKKNLKTLAEKHPDSRDLGGGPPLLINVNVYEVFKTIYITNLVGFILAAFAAAISFFTY